MKTTVLALLGIIGKPTQIRLESYHKGDFFKTSARRDMGLPVGEVSLTAEGGSLTVESLKVHEMALAWKMK